MPESEPRDSSLPAPKPRTRSKNLLFRGSAIFGSTAIALIGVELLLRVLGYGYSTHFFVHHPLLAKAALVENARFGWRFFPRSLARRPRPFAMPAAKPPGTFRVFVFGESAAIGDPDPAFGFARILQVLLEDRYPHLKFEFINTAFVAINSHVILPIAREAARQQGDLWLIYLGNNEPTGPFGADPVYTRSTPPLPLIRAQLRLKEFRFGQFIDALEQHLLRGKEPARTWVGMGLHSAYQVRATDPRLIAVYGNFARNLDDILRAAEQARAPVLLSTIAVNLRDSAPFGSQHRADLATAELETWERFFQKGSNAQQHTNLVEALANYQQAERIDAEFADLAFRIGTCQLALGNGEQAREHFRKARDLDTLRFRADTQINQIIRKMAAQHSATRLIDTEVEFAREPKDGVPGSESFYEHVHLRPSGNYRLARLFADQVERCLPKDAPPSAPGQSWLTLEECLDKLAFGYFSRDSALRTILARLEQAPFTNQSNHAEMLVRLNTELSQLRPFTKNRGLDRDIQLCEDALRERPNDWTLHNLLAYESLSRGKFDQAEAAWNRVLELLPHYAPVSVDLGRLAVRQNNLLRAEQSFARAIAADPDDADAHYELGSLLERQGRLADARRELSTAFRLRPEYKVLKNPSAQPR